MDFVIAMFRITNEVKSVTGSVPGAVATGLI